MRDSVGTTVRATTSVPRSQRRLSRAKGPLFGHQLTHRQNKTHGNGFARVIHVDWCRPLVTLPSWSNELSRRNCRTTARTDTVSRAAKICLSVSSADVGVPRNPEPCPGESEAPAPSVLQATWLATLARSVVSSLCCCRKPSSGGLANRSAKKQGVVQSCVALAFERSRAMRPNLLRIAFRHHEESSRTCGPMKTVSTLLLARYTNQERTAFASPRANSASWMRSSVGRP